LCLAGAQTLIATALDLHQHDPDDLLVAEPVEDDEVHGVAEEAPVAGLELLDISGKSGAKCSAASRVWCRDW
jgi:hypothetical protein